MYWEYCRAAFDVDIAEVCEMYMSDPPSQQTLDIEYDHLGEKMAIHEGQTR